MIKVYAAGGLDSAGKNMLYSFFVEAGNGAEPFREVGLSHTENPIVAEYEGVFRGLLWVKLKCGMRSQAEVNCSDVIVCRMDPASPTYGDPEDREISTARANIGSISRNMDVNYVRGGEENPARILIRQTRNELKETSV